jgi:hypothetical protein
VEQSVERRARKQKYSESCPSATFSPQIPHDLPRAITEASSLLLSTKRWTIVIRNAVVFVLTLAALQHCYARFPPSYIGKSINIRNVAVNFISIQIENLH